MSELVCNFCQKTFKDKYILDTHQKTALFCLKLQNKDLEASFKCEVCDKVFSLKSNYNKHFKNCKEKDDKKNYKELYENCLKQNNKLKIKKNYVENLEVTIEEQNKKIKDLEDDYKILVDKYQKTLEELASKAIENAGNKTTNNIVNNKNRILNNMQPLTTDYMKEQAKFLTYKNISNGIEGMAHFASNYTFKDRLFCSDVSRLNFIFKNEDNNIIKDPEGVEITKRFIEINKEELLRLLDEYYKYILEQLERDLDAIEYRHWSTRREEIIATRCAVKRGNVQDNKENYSEFKKSFLSALSELVAR